MAGSETVIDSLILHFDLTTTTTTNRRLRRVGFIIQSSIALGGACSLLSLLLQSLILDIVFEADAIF